MTFGEAIELVKQGNRVARKGWNGKGMFIFMRPSDKLSTDMIINHVKSLPQSVKDFFKSKNDVVDVEFTEYLCMYSADGKIINGWLASQTDILTNDWVLL